MPYKIVDRRPGDVATVYADTAKAARRPDPARGVFLANQDFGPQFCWATGSLIVAERVLMDLGVSKPAWLNATWYADRVASMP